MITIQLLRAYAGYITSDLFDAYPNKRFDSECGPGQAVRDHRLSLSQVSRNHISCKSSKPRGLKFLHFQPRRDSRITKISDMSDLERRASYAL